MKYFNWENVRCFYMYYTKNNNDFIKKLKDCYNNNYIKGTEIINHDLTESTNQTEELTQLYKENKLVTVRLGCVENSFFVHQVFNIRLPTHLLINNNTNIDK